MKNRKSLLVPAIFLGTTSACWAAPPEALVKNEGLLMLSCGVLFVAWVVQVSMEIKAGRTNHGLLEIDRLAAAAASKPVKTSDAAQIASDSASSPGFNPMLAARQSAEGAPRPSSMSAPPPPPPPPPPVPRTPSAMAPPPPPPPPPPADDDSNPFSRAVADANQTVKVPTKSNSPISLPTGGAPPPPPNDGSASSGGGWADLLQRVRTGGESDAGAPPAPFKPALLNQSPRTEPEVSRPAPPSAAGGGDAWEALLKKTSGAGAPSPALGSNPFKSSEGSSPFKSAEGGPFGGASGETPNALDLSGSGEDSLPDFVKKATPTAPGRTISLDANKGGGSNPFSKDS